VAANKLASPYWSYAVGQESRKHYLESAFGCEYGALEYAQQRLRGTVIDNWTQWHDNVLNIFITRTPFQNFAPVPGTSLREQLRRGALRYVYVRTSLKKKFGQETRSAPDTLEAAYFKPRYAAEQKILRFSKIIWREGECRIYRIEGV
jgi:hypothetical protein